MESQRMERGLIDEYFDNETNKIKIKQIPRGCFEECFECGKSKELVWYNVFNQFHKKEFATSFRETNGCVRLFSCGFHGFEMDVKENGTTDTILHIDKPCTSCTSSCKCCCYNKLIISTNGEKIGSVQEQFYVCVPRFIILDGSNIPIYTLHSPTCCCGICVDCKNADGCCRFHETPYHVYPFSQSITDGDAPFLSKIVKVSKTVANMQAYDITFPENSTSDQKALISCSSVLINSTLFE